MNFNFLRCQVPMITSKTLLPLAGWTKDVRKHRKQS
ncbi:hypothetical protein V6Z12_A11G198600 [Gossypium hirsutum]